MDQFGNYDRQEGQVQSGQDGSTSANEVRGYNPYGQWDDRAHKPPRKEKGIKGIVVACTLSAALIGGTLGGAGGMALGYKLAPKEAPEAQQQVPAAVQQAPLQETADEPARAAAQPVASLEMPMTIPEIVKKVQPSVVAIDATVTQRQQTPFGIYESEGEGSGSGVIISQDGYIVTNNHVVEDATNIVVYLNDGESYDAELIGRDSRTDMAILKIEATGLPAAELGDSGALEVGDIAIAIGNPLGELAGSVTQGIISAREREVTIENERMNLLQFDAAINQGNSGGALVNGSGQLVGIVNAKTMAVGVEGLGFAIPIDDVKDIIEDIMTNGYVTGRPLLGISTRDVTEEIAKAYNMPVGVYIAGIEAFSAAERAGLQIGDVIIRFDGQAVANNEELTAIRDLHKPGDTLEVVVNRNGQEQTFEITLTEDISGR